MPFIKINVEVALSELTGVRHSDFSVLASARGSALLFSQCFCLPQAVGFLGKSSQLQRAHQTVDASQLGISHVTTIKIKMSRDSEMCA